MQKLIKIRLLNHGGYGDKLDFPIEVDGFSYSGGGGLMCIYGKELSLVGFTGVLPESDYAFMLGTECEIV
jgi:hypothetical protein